MLKSELQAKIRSLKQKLDEMRQYKQVLAEDGAEPDRADKERESELIVRLIHLEKDLARLEGRPYKSHAQLKAEKKHGPRGPKGRKDSKGSKGSKSPRSQGSRKRK